MRSKPEDKHKTNKLEDTLHQQAIKSKETNSGGVAMSELKLEVGKKYRTRGGQEVKVIHKMSTRLHPFVGSNGCTYKDDGMWLYTQGMNEDLVEEIIEPKLKLEVGKKYRTRGGQEVKIIDEKNDEDNEDNYPYVGDNGYTYTERGLWHIGQVDIDDLVEEITEPETNQQEIRPMFDKKYKYVAMDEDGYCKFFVAKPNLHEDVECWYSNKTDEPTVVKGVFNLGNDWKESLREIVHNDDGSVYLRKPRYDFKVDDKVLVKNFEEVNWKKRHFRSYESDGWAEVFESGQTSFTGLHTEIWDEIKPYVEGQ